MPRRRDVAAATAALVALPTLLWATVTPAQEALPWARNAPPRYEDPGAATAQAPRTQDGYAPRYGAPRGGAEGDAYRPPRAGDGSPGAPSVGQGYGAAPPAGPYPQGQPYPAYAGPPNPGAAPPPGYGQPYTPPTGYEDPSGRGYGPGAPYDRRYGGYDDGPPDTYSSREIIQTGHGFFGSVSKGLASVVEYAFKNQGRPNGYILGQEAGGAFVAGLRYGEGVLYTRDAGTHRVYWQGASIGYDAGAEGSKVMILVYNLRDPGEIYQRFGGVDGSAYFVGGVGVTFQKSGDIVVAPIRSGVGLRLGANVGYLKYTPRPTWNPF
jgi:hypothetical protein